MPFPKSTPEQIAFAQTRQREYNRRYRLSAKGKAAHIRGQAKYRQTHKEQLDAKRRLACVVCGGPKEPGKGFRKCNECWGVREDKDLEALIAEQAQDMYLDSVGVVQPQRFSHNLNDHPVYPLDWRDEGGDVDEWSDPTFDEVQDRL